MINLKNLLTEAVCGLCFQWAYRRVLKGGPFLELVHGTIYPPYYHKRINHAWVETKRNVFDWQNHGRGRKEGLENIGMWVDDDKKQSEIFKRGFDKKEFYKMAKIKVDDKYKKHEAAMKMIKQQHMGPWD